MVLFILILFAMAICFLVGRHHGFSESEALWVDALTTTEKETITQ